MKREKQKRTRIIIFLTSILLLMTVGYAAYNTNLNITGTSNISNSWDIEITNISDPVLTGSAKHVASEIGTNKLSASMEADLYDEGDSAEYTVTIENKGSVDAALDSITKDTSNSNENIDITFSGYTKGERLSAGDTMDIKVKIAYPSETSFNTNNTNNNIKLMSTNTLATGEVKITFNFVQAEGYEGSEDYPIPDTYLVEYDCTTNGDKDCTEYNEYLKEGESVDLSNVAKSPSEKVFIGWNTNSNATTKLNSLAMGQNNIKLYAIYGNDTITFDTLKTTVTTNSITVVAKATSLSGIAKYEFSKDGEEYFEGSIDAENNNSTYTFTNLTQNETYPIYVKVTSNNGKTKIKNVYTTELGAETISSLAKNNTETMNTADPDNNVRYMGKNPNNYITFNEEKDGIAGWRIIGVFDGNIKIIKNKPLFLVAYNSSYYNDWSKSSLMERLNSGDYWTNELSSIAKGQIKEAKWNLGGWNTSLVTASQIYGYERGTTVYCEDINDNSTCNPTVWTGKVALMYPSDYGYASSACNDGSKTLAYYNNSCSATNWLVIEQYEGKSQWLLSASSDSKYTAFRVETGATVRADLTEGGVTRNDYGARPTLYLKKGIKLSGTGTEKEPFIIEKAGVNTKTLGTPTFTETTTSNGKRITIDYHKECGSNGITCTYIKDEETTENLTGSTQTVDFTDDGTLVATISDGTNTVSTSSYMIKEVLVSKTLKKLNVSPVTTEDGLYADSTDSGRYTYKGSAPNNYFTFNGDKAGWRIVSIERDGTIKIIKKASIATKAWDTTSTRNSSTDTYCKNASDYGCNAWAKTSSLASANSTFSSEIAIGIFHQYGSNGGTSGTDYNGTVTVDASLNTYLNETYYTSTLGSNTNIDYHAFNVSTPGNVADEEDIATDAEQEKLYTWNGYVGLITATDYMRASTSTPCTTLKAANTSPYPCKDNNYLFTDQFDWWTISPNVTTYRYSVFYIRSSGNLSTTNATGKTTNSTWTSNTIRVRPALYLKSNLNFTGSGTSDDPYEIGES